MSKRIFVLLGHPDTRGLCGTAADAYEMAAREAGHDVQRLNIGDLKFDPVLYQGYRARQELEPDLLRFQELVQWSEHVVIIHPIWWYGMPAIMKGLFDRAWLPGSAFRYMKTKEGKRLIFWHRLYRGKSARIIVTSGSHPLLICLFPGSPNAQLRWGILWFAGFCVRTLWLGPSENVSQERQARWMEKIRTLAYAAR